jgi:hypothetical protein
VTAGRLVKKLAPGENGASDNAEKIADAGRRIE